MRLTHITFDLSKGLAMVGAILLMAGVLPFTPVWVGILILLAASSLAWTWRF